MRRLGRESLGTHSQDPTPQMMRGLRACVYICAFDHACVLTIKVYHAKTL